MLNNKLDSCVREGQKIIDKSVKERVGNEKNKTRIGKDENKRQNSIS